MWTSAKKGGAGVYRMRLVENIDNDLVKKSGEKYNMILEVVLL